MSQQGRGHSLWVRCVCPWIGVRCGSRSQHANTCPQQEQAESSFGHVFTPIPWFCWALWPLELDRLCKQHAAQGHLTPPLQAPSSPCADPIVYGTCAAQGRGCQGGRHLVGLSSVSCQAVFRKGDEADGPDEGPLTHLLLGWWGGYAEAWAGCPGSQRKSPPSWAPGCGVARNLLSPKLCFWLLTEG